MNLKNKVEKYYIVFVCLFVCFVLVGYFLIKNFDKNTTINDQLLPPTTGDCLIEKKSYTVNGSSMKGVVEDGVVVEVLVNYYQCNTILKNDIVLYNYAGNENPLIKIVKGVPGDTLALSKNNATYHILINGKVLKNTENNSYELDSRAYRMLSLYVSDYQGLVPADTYLIMGNLVSGSTDSSKFGLISKKDIIGKVILP